MGTDEHLDATLRKFWEVEEVSNPVAKTAAEMQAEEHYKETVSRHSTGRYIVKLPFITMSSRNELAPSRNAAITRLRQMEFKLAKHPMLRQEYVNFMDDYHRLGHMQRVPAAEIFMHGTHYLPHHAVLKEDSTTTKLRVVFDASHKTASRKSPNDLLLIGPTLQEQ